VTVDCKTICDGVAVPYVADEMFPILRAVADESVLVPEAAVESAMRRLALGNRIIVEPSAALAVAAALAAPPEKRGRAVCIVTGGSIDFEAFVRIVRG
jgi:threonine dehydratase